MWSIFCINLPWCSILDLVPINYNIPCLNLWIPEQKPPHGNDIHASGQVCNPPGLHVFNPPGKAGENLCRHMEGIIYFVILSCSCFSLWRYFTRTVRHTGILLLFYKSCQCYEIHTFNFLCFKMCWYCSLISSINCIDRKQQVFTFSHQSSKAICHLAGGFSCRDLCANNHLSPLHSLWSWAHCNELTSSSRQCSQCYIWDRVWHLPVREDMVG